jgi:hypothetical protein
MTQSALLEGQGRAFPEVLGENGLEVGTLEEIEQGLERPR